MDKIYHWFGFLGFWTISGLLAFGVLSWVVTVIRRPSRQQFYKGKHVVVTGASTGLGRAFAELAVKAGANVTIISRNPKRLAAAETYLRGRSGAGGGKVCAVACDVSDADQVVRAFGQGVGVHGPPNLVVCSAGLSHPGYFAEMPVAQFQSEMSLNYMGTVHAFKAAVAEMVDSTDLSGSGGKRGHLVSVSSAAALAGFIGYSGYAPTKYALTGLCDSLRNELHRHQIGVSIFYPASIDSPGFATENLTKPAECREIEGTADCLSPDACAALLDQGLRSGQYAITTELLCELLSMGSNHLTPRNNICLEMLLAPLLPPIQTILHKIFDKTVTDHQAKKKEKLK